MAETKIERTMVVPIVEIYDTEDMTAEDAAIECGKMLTEGTSPSVKFPLTDTEADWGNASSLVGSTYVVYAPNPARILDSGICH
ncbi:MAG: hypothetical protein J6Y37_13500 [Paludibacteraceae bacterium]|nr:hypothetical protein [Paludibacteraceae bacterium]